jgi:hypothetical protein
MPGSDTMQPHGLGALLLALALALAVPSAAGPSWHILTQAPNGSERGFSVELPAPPQHAAKQLTSGAGVPYTLERYLLEQDEAAFVVETVTYPPEVTLAAPRTHLQEGLDNAGKNMSGGKWARVDWVTREGVAAVDALGVRGGKEVRTFSVLKGRQLVTLTYAGPSGSGQGDDVNRFIASLRFAENP